MALRGGAPFLSAADDRLLVQWLEAGLSVPLILAAIDQVAERRRKKRVKTRLTLSACRRAVEAQGGTAAAPALAETPAQPPPTASAVPALAELADELARAPVGPGSEAALAELVATLRALAAAGGHPDAVGRAATVAVTRFHAAAWEAAAPRHAELRARAEAQLAPLRRTLRGAAWQEMVDEVARDLLRQESPAVSARQVWDRLAP